MERNKENGSNKGRIRALRLTDRVVEVTSEAVETFGRERQMRKAVEELNELSVELLHTLDGRGRESGLAEETADACLMLLQVAEMMDSETLEETGRMLSSKLERLERLVAAEKRRNGGAS